MLSVVFAVLVGLIAGIVINVLADEIPYRRGLWWPTYPDGARRPPTAWLGLLAFILGQREPKQPEPNEAHARPHLGHNRLGWRYPLVELAAIGLMLLAVFATRDDSGMTAAQLVFYWVELAILLLIFVTDIELRMIYRIVTRPALVIALLDALLLPVLAPGIKDAAAGTAFGFGIFYLIYLGGVLFVKVITRSSGEVSNTGNPQQEENSENQAEANEDTEDEEIVAFGFGDVRLMAFCGALLGFLGTFLAMFIAIFLGAIGAIVYLIGKRFLSGQYSAFSPIPYGPYIIIATIIVMFYREPVAAAVFGW
ncbi:MAG: prepilin peptidase [Anaerolineae bacterium]|nr:prepilin peptidase [Anaerolineae bacterium]